MKEIVLTNPATMWIPWDKYPSEIFNSNPQKEDLVKMQGRNLGAIVSVSKDLVIMAAPTEASKDHLIVTEFRKGEQVKEKYLGNYNGEGVEYQKIINKSYNQMEEQN